MAAGSVWGGGRRAPEASTVVCDLVPLRTYCNCSSRTARPNCCGAGAQSGAPQSPPSWRSGVRHADQRERPCQDARRRSGQRGRPTQIPEAREKIEQRAHELILPEYQSRMGVRVGSIGTGSRKKHALLKVVRRAGGCLTSSLPEGRDVCGEEVESRSLLTAHSTLTGCCVAPGAPRPTMGATNSSGAESGCPAANGRKRLHNTPMQPYWRYGGAAGTPPPREQRGTALAPQTRDARTGDRSKLRRLVDCPVDGSRGKPLHEPA